MFELNPILDCYIFGNHSDKLIVNFLSALYLCNGIAIRGLPLSGKKKSFEMISILLARPFFHWDLSSE